VFAAVSEYEMPSRVTRELTVEDVIQLMGASTPHFALQIRNRIRHLIASLPADHPARVLGEREIARLDRLARDGEERSELLDLPKMPSLAREG
jgi:hypothetical protein